MKTIFALFFLLTIGFLNAQNNPLKVPNFKFPDGKSLSDFGTPGIVLVYGESNCPACQQAQTGLHMRYKKWATFGYTVVYIALDEDKPLLTENFGTPPWPMYCDEKVWESPWVKALDVYGTPTLFALNNALEVEYEAKNVGQMDFWIYSLQ